MLSATSSTASPGGARPCNLACEIPQWFPWNGSKRWLVKHLIPVFQGWAGQGKYIEPFVGGGSIATVVKSLFQTKQYLSDANPWLISAFQSQVLGCSVADNYADINYWRNLNDNDLPNLSVAERANRFAICLFTAWGNRWETRIEGSFRSTTNPKFCREDYLKRRLEQFFSVRWLTENDEVKCCDWKEAVKEAKAGDLVYMDSPYPESLGYGNNWWSFSDHLDVVDWSEQAIKQGISVVVSNMWTIERLYRHIGMQTTKVIGPKSSKTRRDREEVIAWKIEDSCCK
jgi:DNA adenine methylase